MNPATILSFLMLQCCDFGTTMWFLDRGVTEGNPLVNAVLRLSPSHAGPLLMVKVLGCALGVLAWRMGRMRLLRIANWAFALCVGWNLLAILGA
jgi:hypothetical protein